MKNYKRYYNFFLALTLLSLIDIVTTSIVEMQYKIHDTGLITLGLYYVLGKVGLYIGIYLRLLFIVFGIIAVVLNRKIKKQNKQSEQLKS